MSDSTSILDLPTDPVGGGNISNNINLSATETRNSQNQNQNPNQNSGLSLDASTISQIRTSLQEASIHGATKLSSRDIPMISPIDPSVQTDYVPPPPPYQKDYIRNYDDSDIIQDYNHNKQNQNSLDEMYNEIQTPLLLGVLYFLFQLPFFKKFLFQYTSFFFSIDGNLNLNGFLFTSLLFSIIYYTLNKITLHFGKF